MVKNLGKEKKQNCCGLTQTSSSTIVTVSEVGAVHCVEKDVYERRTYSRCGATLCVFFLLLNY